jgi:hypothetical protein
MNEKHDATKGEAAKRRDASSMPPETTGSVRPVPTRIFSVVGKDHRESAMLILSDGMVKIRASNVQLPSDS